MKNTLASIAVLLFLTAGTQAGEPTYYSGTQASQARWYCLTSFNAEAKRARGDVCYRGLTEWNLPSARNAAAAARRSPGYVPTPRPRFSGAGTQQYPMGGYVDSYNNYSVPYIR